MDRLLADMNLLSKPGRDAQSIVCMDDSSCGHNMYKSHRIAGISPSGQVEVWAEAHKAQHICYCFPFLNMQQQDIHG